MVFSNDFPGFLWCFLSFSLVSHDGFRVQKSHPKREAVLQKSSEALEEFARRDDPTSQAGRLGRGPESLGFFFI